MLPVYGLSEATCAVAFADVEKEATYHSVRKNALVNEDVTTDTDSVSGNTVELPRLGTPFGDFSISARDFEDIDVGEDKIGRVFVKGRDVSHAV